MVSDIAGYDRLVNRLWFVRVLLLACLFAGFSVTMLPAEMLPESDEPCLATVIGQNAFLRSGPGDDYYATNRIAAGQVLEVYYVIDDLWCAVRPPSGSFTWVDARNVRLGKNQVGEVLINGVSARVGSELGNMCGAVQVVLDSGEKVFVFERIETPGDIDTPVWYKIAPPAGEFRFVRLADLNDRSAEIPRDRDVYVICRSGGRSAYATQALAGAGWKAINVSDGMTGWAVAGRPMISETGGEPFVA